MKDALRILIALLVLGLVWGSFRSCGRDATTPPVVHTSDSLKVTAPQFQAEIAARDSVIARQDAERDSLDRVVRGSKASAARSRAIADSLRAIAPDTDADAWREIAGIHRAEADTLRAALATTDAALVLSDSVIARERAIRALYVERLAVAEPALYEATRLLRLSEPRCTLGFGIRCPSRTQVALGTAAITLIGVVAVIK